MGRTDKIIDLLRVDSPGRVIFLTVLCTAFTVAASVCAVSFAMRSIPAMPQEALIAVLGLAAFIPIIITPPLAFIMLNIMRFLTNTVNHVGQQVRFDPMTGLYSRHHFLEMTRMHLEDGGAFLMIDADHFKRINDTYGHATGDEALKRLAQALRAAGKPGSLIGRLGGEEFGMFIPKGRLTDADTAAIRISAAVSNLCHTIAGHEIFLTASVGAAVHVPGMPLEEMLRLADERLYRAKNAGRNRAVLSETPPIVPDFSGVELWEDAPTSAAG
jgi:diguanylate cyclase